MHVENKIDTNLEFDQIAEWYKIFTQSEILSYSSNILSLLFRF